MGLAFRHELKYIINEREKDILERQLILAAEKDPNAQKKGTGSYFIRSLYFDDRHHRSYNEKIDGVDVRAKYRIRIYDMQDKLIRLEKKEKVGSYIRKTEALLSREEAECLSRGDPFIIADRSEPLLREFYILCLTEMMRPEVMVDYTRVPYVYDLGTVRITFDMHLRAGYPGSLFDSGMPSYEAMEPGQLILEVKYTELLPEIFREVLQPMAGSYTAASKFILCVDKKREYRGISV